MNGILVNFVPITKSHMQDEGDDDMLNPEEYGNAQKPNSSAEDEMMEDDIVESDIELDDSGVVEPDNDPQQKMGDPSIEVTEENRDAAQLSKSKAMDAMSEGILFIPLREVYNKNIHLLDDIKLLDLGNPNHKSKLDEAIEHLTEAILLNPSTAILYGSRASVFVKMSKPNAAIRDADAALQINPDSAKGYKVRGMARAMLGQWEEAARDLHVASKLDYDEEIGMVLKKVIYIDFRLDAGYVVAWC
ncbi:hypothetical protein HHK36_014826 [Tetracentron sinense]|uniref:Uncharacterized protein n=1 Tax=Tetracentron sinense TaxID=13715 RepID=A0A834Z868_TETSI|nr:hypothetical protein HHK36_014826 [Tetracentron sinense]